MLTFRRLAILDLSEAGRQPMQSVCGRWVIAFNGEIYNFQSLKEQVVRSGQYKHPFRGRSDTEVLLAAISIWGVEKALDQAEGMFALALWDEQLGQLCLARDRFGEKPLYYTWSNGVLVFGSEIHALLGYPGTQFEVDESSLHSYFRYGYFPAPSTVYKNVRKLTPGNLIQIDSRGGAEERPYWDIAERIDQSRSHPFTGSVEEAVTILNDKISDSVRLRMISDVPLGAFLSGGLDSSIVVAAMQRQSRQPIKTFCIGFSDAAYDESQFAQRVARHLGTEHEEWIISPQQAHEVIPSLGKVYDEPLADASQIPTLLVSSLARRKVTVCLSGDAGDELFGGYDRYHWAQSLESRLSLFPLSTRRLLGRTLAVFSGLQWERAYLQWSKALPRKLRFRNPADKFEKLTQFLSAADSQSVYRSIVSQWPKPQQILAGGVEQTVPCRMQTIPKSLDDLVSRMMFMDFVTYMSDDVLMKVDRASMFHGLEVRVPFLERSLIEFVWSLPSHWKVENGKTKVVLRKLLNQYFPEHFFDRPKQGFSLPVDVWLRGGLRDWAESLLSEKRLADSGLLNASAIREIWRQHLVGERNHAQKLWSVLQFQSWWFAQGD